MLAGLSVMVVINFALGLLLLCRRGSKGRKEIVEAPTVAYKKGGEVHLGPAQVEIGGESGQGNDPEVAQDWFYETSSIWYHATSQPSLRVSASTLIQMWRAEGQGSGT